METGREAEIGAETETEAETHRERKRVRKKNAVCAPNVPAFFRIDLCSIDEFVGAVGKAHSE